MPRPLRQVKVGPHETPEDGMSQFLGTVVFILTI